MHRDSRVSTNLIKTQLHKFQDRATQRKELAAVMYDTNVLGFKGPRRMTVVLPGMNSEGRRVEFRSISDHDGLLERFKSKNLVTNHPQIRSSDLGDLYNSSLPSIPPVQ